MAREIPDEQRCTARSKRSGQRCERYRTPGRNVCRMHGGRSLRGVEHPHFRHGGKVEFLPERYRRAYVAALESPDGDDLRAQIALLEAREVELLQRLTTAESGQAWTAAHEAFTELSGAIRSGDAGRMGASLATLREVIESGERDEEQWQELRENMEARRKMIETQSRAVEKAGAYLTIVELLTLATRLARIVAEEVADTKARERITKRWEKILNPVIDVTPLRIEAGG